MVRPARRAARYGAGGRAATGIDISNGVPFAKAVVWQDGKDYSNEPQIGLTLTPVGCDTALNSYITSDNKAMMVFAMEEPLGATRTHVRALATIELQKRALSAFAHSTRPAPQAGVAGRTGP